MICKNHQGKVFIKSKNNNFSFKRLYYCMINLYKTLFLLFITFLVIPAGFAEATSTTVSAINPVGVPANNKYSIYMMPDPCKRKVPFQANRQYEELRIYIEPLEDDGGYIERLFFRNHSYLWDIKKEIEDAFKSWKEEVGISYKFVGEEDFDTANIIVITNYDPSDSEMNTGLLAKTNTKGNIIYDEDNPEIKEVSSKASIIFIPKNEYLKRIMRMVENNYNEIINRGYISKEATPDVFFYILWSYTLKHEAGHALGFEHSYTKDEVNENPISAIKIPDEKQYDLQPSIMVPTINKYLEGLIQWSKNPIYSKREIIPSPQDIDAYKYAQQRSHIQSGIDNRQNSPLQCDNYQITFGEE